MSLELTDSLLEVEVGLQDDISNKFLCLQDFTRAFVRKHQTLELELY